MKLTVHFGHVPSLTASSPYTPQTFSYLPGALVPFCKCQSQRGRKRGSSSCVFSGKRATRTFSSWDEVFFLDADTTAAPTESDKTVSKDVKGKYEQLRTRNGVAGGGGGSRVGERTGFLA